MTKKDGRTVFQYDYFFRRKYNVGNISAILPERIVHVPRWVLAAFKASLRYLLIVFCSMRFS